MVGGGGRKLVWQQGKYFFCLPQERNSIGLIIYIWREINPSLEIFWHHWLSCGSGSIHQWSDDSGELCGGQERRSEEVGWRAVQGWQVTLVLEQPLKIRRK